MKGLFGVLFVYWVMCLKWLILHLPILDHILCTFYNFCKKCGNVSTSELYYLICVRSTFFGVVQHLVENYKKIKH